MTNHLKRAKKFLNAAEDNEVDVAGQLATIALAHALVALIESQPKPITINEPDTVDLSGTDKHKDFNG